MDEKEEQKEQDSSSPKNQIVKSENGEEIEIIDGFSETCPVCKHPGSSEATEVYFSSHKDIETVRIWFKNKFSKEYNTATVERHFKEHVEPFVKSFSSEKQKKIKSLKNRVAKEDKNRSRLEVMKDIVFDFVTDAYAVKPEHPSITKNAKLEHERLTKQICLLVKTYTDLYKMEMQVLGLGKTEEEQKDLMKNYMVGMIKKVLSAFNDMPEAQDRLKQIFGEAIKDEK